jgi:FG-GAP repeat protein
MTLYHPSTLATMVACFGFWASTAPAQIVGGECKTLYQWNGNQKEGYFGSSVADAGDFNGDGFADLIVGAPLSSLSGVVFVYSGANGEELARWSGPSVNGQFGFSVAGAGDINHDGYDDVMIGASLANFSGAQAAGSVYLYSGATGNLLYQWNGTTAYQNFGTSVAGVRDVNLDGYDDLLVGAPGTKVANKPNAGAAFLYSGANGALLHQLNGNTAYDNFGTALSYAGDVNRDGIPDLIVGAPGADPGGLSSAGMVYVYSGADATLLYQWNGTAADDEFGYSVSNAGDLNRDHYDDLIIGAPWADPHGVSNSGSAYAFSGKDGSMMFRREGKTADDSFGFSVSHAGDFNLDGYADVIIGAPGLNQLGVSSEGTALLCSGADAAILKVWRGEFRGENFGYSVSTAGDVNQNGRPELIVGARNTGTGSRLNGGSAYVYSLDPFLYANSQIISAATGGQIDLRLDFPDAAGLDAYKILISKSGIGPTRFGVAIPLTLDQLVLDTYAGIYRVQSHTHMHGTLNFYGKASASLTLPPAIHPSFIGDTFYFAAISNSPGRDPEYSSTALAVTITP